MLFHYCQQIILKVILPFTVSQFSLCEIAWSKLVYLYNFKPNIGQNNFIKGFKFRIKSQQTNEQTKEKSIKKPETNCWFTHIFLNCCLLKQTFFLLFFKFVKFKRIKWLKRNMIRDFIFIFINYEFLNKAKKNYIIAITKYYFQKKKKRIVAVAAYSFCKFKILKKKFFVYSPLFSLKL